VAAGAIGLLAAGALLAVTNARRVSTEQPVVV
jgi:hypothetical protein